MPAVGAVGGAHDVPGRAQRARPTVNGHELELHLRAEVGGAVADAGRSTRRSASTGTSAVGVVIAVSATTPSASAQMRRASSVLTAPKRERVAGAWGTSS